MRLHWSLYSLLLTSLLTVAGAVELTFEHVGVYADDFDFCNMSVVKVRYFDKQADPERLPRYREQLKQNRLAGRQNLVGLYTFDRVKHSRPIEEYIKNTDDVLTALDLEDVHAVFLCEENVTWNNGLTLLNGLYDHIKGRFPELPVYQWLTAPAGPHPKLKADGWLYDLYGHDRAPFRRKLCEYVITGKPIIMCLNASPDVARFATPQGKPISEAQWEVCREFNVPTFYYCVDLRWGNPFIWWHSSDPELTAWRNWLVDTVERIERTDIAALPERSADYTDAQPLEGAPDENGTFTWEETFASTAFLNHLSTRGFTNLTWNGMSEEIQVRRQSRHRRYVELFSHVVSDFDMANPSATLTLDGRRTRPGAVTVMLSATGHNWPVTKANDGGEEELTVSAKDMDGFQGGPYWIRIRVDAGEAPSEEPAAVFTGLRFGCTITPPEKPGVTLVPEADGTLAFVEDFASSKYRWLAHVENQEQITWNPGQLSTTGVQGRGNRVEIRWPISCDRPMRGIVARLTTRANARHLGATNVFGVSLDGKEPTVMTSTRDLKAGKHGWERGDLVLDLSEQPAFHDITTFWVHAIMTNSSGVKTNPSNIINKLEIRAQAAPQTETP